MNTGVHALSPTPIAVEDRVLEDLQSRLRATIWPEDSGNEDGRYGVPRALHQELARYWAEEYDWRPAERTILGHTRYAAAGCDVGALVTGQLGHKYADELYGIHIGSALKLDLFTGDRAWDLSGGRPIPPELPDDRRRRLVEIERRFAMHLAAHVLAPSTLGYGLAYSPVGMLAWILERWMKWSDNGGDIYTAFSRDDLLTQTIYWTGNAIASSIRTYANNNRYPGHPRTIGHRSSRHRPGLRSSNTRIPPESSARKSASSRFWQAIGPLGTTTSTSPSTPKGGHFIPWEIPGRWTADLVRTFKS